MQYVKRQEEEVLFVRRIGNYQNTPFEAFTALFNFLDKEKNRDCVRQLYGMGLDDCGIVEKGKVRFDACAYFDQPICECPDLIKDRLNKSEGIVYIYIPII